MITNPISQFLIDNYDKHNNQELVSQIESLFNVKLSSKNIQNRVYNLRKKNISIPYKKSKENSKVNFQDHVKYEIQTDTNTITLTGTLKNKPSDKSITKLLDDFEIDTDTWFIDRKIIQAIEKNSFEDFFKVILHLKRKNPIANVLPIQPINVNYNYNFQKSKITRNKTKKLKTALIVPDSQNGYIIDLNTKKLEPMHDRHALDLVIQVADYIKPDKIVLLGDHLDLAEWSDKFVRSPEYFFTTQPALIELHWWLKRLRDSNPNAEMDYLEGNHEKRLLDSIKKHNLVSFGLHPANFKTNSESTLSIPYLLALKELNINYHSNYPDGEVWINDNLVCTHGEKVRQSPGATASSILQSARCSEIFGHIHRIEMVGKTTHSRKGAISYKAFCPGCICRIDGAVPAFSKRNNWQQGFAVVNYEEGNGLFEITPISINNQKCVFDNQIFESKFDLKEFQQSINYPAFNI